MISIAICDDEVYMQNDLQEKIKMYMQKNKFTVKITLFSSSEEILANRSKFNIIFMDIQMKEINGMQAAKKIRNYDKECFIVFTTVLKEFVWESFEVDASNYLLKPLSQEKLFYTLDKITKQLLERKNQYLVIHRRQAYQRVKIADILYCEVISRKIYLHMKDETVDYYDTIQNLKKILPKYFFLCHRSYLVNLEFVIGYENGNILMENKELIPISRLRQQEFTQEMLVYMKKRGI